MSPAIMFCGASDDGERFAGLSPVAKFFCPLWSFCLIVVLLGVGARDFLAALSFRPRTNVARSRGRPQLRVATLGSCNECGARRALAYSAN